MKIFDSKIDLLRRASPAKSGKRFLSWCLDALIVFLMGYFIFLAGYNGIVKNLESYKNFETTIKEEISYYNDFIEETHLVSFTTNENNEKIRLDNDLMCLNNIKGLIRASYDLGVNGVDNIGYEDYWKDLNVTSEELDGNADHSNAFLGTATNFDNDNIAYFYTNYVPKHNTNNDFIDFKGKDPRTYFAYDVFKNMLGNSYSVYFSDIKEDSLTFPRLKAEYASSMFTYLIRSETSEVGKQTYSNIYTIYDNLESKAEEIVLNSKTYYKEHYVKFVNANNGEVYQIVITILLSFIVAYLIFVLAFIFFFKDGVTVGRFALSLAIIGNNGEKIKWYIALLRGLIDLVFFLPLMILVGIMPPFGGTFLYLNISLFSIGTFSVNLFMILTAIFCLSLVNGIFILLSHYHRSLEDLIFKNTVVDIKHLDEEDIDERSEGTL